MKKSLFCILFVFYSISVFGQCIMPENFEYVGAFRLPDVSGEVTWDYSGTAITYFPDGDKQGTSDGFPGSLFLTGHDWYQYVSEISIPSPVISPSKNVNDLNTAVTLQVFTDIKAGMFGELEMPTPGLTFLPDISGATSGYLYFCWGQHFQFHEATHGFCRTDLSSPQSHGPFYFGNINNYTSSDYMFRLPDTWAKEYTNGQNLASGRFREGQWSGFGPALYAFSPFPNGAEPAANDTITQITPLLLYGLDDPTIPEIVVDDSMKMNMYNPADQWSGAAWISAGDKEAVIFAGTKAMGNTWYGFADGTVWPDEPPYPPVPDPPYDDRGWWCDSIHAQIIFYDTDDLADVAQGRLKPWNPQPYAVLDINNILFSPGFDLVRYKRWSIGAICFDFDHQHLFIVERLADEDKSIVHVWSVSDNGTGTEETESALPGRPELYSNYPNPFNPETAIKFTLPNSGRVHLSIYDIKGREITNLINEDKQRGTYLAVWNGCNKNGRKVSSGLYIYRLKFKNQILSGKMVLAR